ncbi:hypothetical protein GCK72_022354 [Caenorhabditis remanei]|uniref:Uncharacterized protein n=1 Tax=Caenorhabditis remanei TaxID=31234 RepID=A0A6A5FTJ1_CAERE|nr:hypothetical protein GCK72_022354 [Caenorhabditis remanei]KAF1745907.1 hypothetical protein GCK72_022354 [Caenorhabditis remanei]
MEKPQSESMDAEVDQSDTSGNTNSKTQTASPPPQSDEPLQRVEETPGSVQAFSNALFMGSPELASLVQMESEFRPMLSQILAKYFNDPSIVQDEQLCQPFKFISDSIEIGLKTFLQDVDKDLANNVRQKCEIDRLRIGKALVETQYAELNSRCEQLEDCLRLMQVEQMKMEQNSSQRVEPMVGKKRKCEELGREIVKPLADGEGDNNVKENVELENFENRLETRSDAFFARFEWLKKFVTNQHVDLQIAQRNNSIKTNQLQTLFVLYDEFLKSEGKSIFGNEFEESRFPDFAEQRQKIEMLDKRGKEREQNVVEEHNDDTHENLDMLHIEHGPFFFEFLKELIEQHPSCFFSHEEIRERYNAKYYTELPMKFFTQEFQMLETHPMLEYSGEYGKLVYLCMTQTPISEGFKNKIRELPDYVTVKLDDNNKVVDLKFDQASMYFNRKWKQEELELNKMNTGDKTP